MTTGFVGASSLLNTGANDYTGLTVGPTVSYTCPAGVKYAVLTIHYSLSLVGGFSSTLKVAGITNLTCIKLMSTSNPNGNINDLAIADSNTVNIILGPNQSWSGAPHLHLGSPSNATGSALLTVSVLEILV